KIAAGELVAHMGKARLAADLDPQDFAKLRSRMAKKWGLYRLGVNIQHIRSILKHAFDARLIPTPVQFGPGIARPTTKAIRLHKAREGPKLSRPDELRVLLKAAGVQLKAMLLLGMICAFGNSDCGNLPLSAVTLDTGWIDSPRPKTSIPRRCL